MLRNDVRKPAWDSMSRSRQVPVFHEGEYAIRTRKAIYNIAQILLNRGSQIVIQYMNDRGVSIHEGIMVADIVSARRMA